MGDRVRGPRPASDVGRSIPTVRADDTLDPTELCPTSEWRQLSDGGYSEVYKAQLLGVTVAVKQATSRKKTSSEALLREIRYIRLAGPHPNIVQPYGAFIERGTLHLVLEYARQCLRTDRVARSADPVIVFAGVARALVRLHGVGIVHRDLKARNVLIAENHRPLLIDFGLACHVSDSPEWMGRTVGTKKYRPPEMSGNRPALPSSDMYCFGRMIDKLLRQRARDSGSSEESSHRSERRDVRLLHDIAAMCMCRQPEERLSAWDVLRKLQRHVGEEVGRCSDERSRVPLSATRQSISTLLPRDESAEDGERSRPEASLSGANTRSRKRRRGRSQETEPNGNGPPSARGSARSRSDG